MGARRSRTVAPGSDDLIVAPRVAPSVAPNVAPSVAPRAHGLSSVFHVHALFFRCPLLIFRAVSLILHVLSLICRGPACSFIAPFVILCLGDATPPHWLCTVDLRALLQAPSHTWRVDAQPKLVGPTPWPTPWPVP